MRNVVLAVVAVLWVNGAASVHGQAPSTEASLYKRLGGYDAIAAVTDAFIKKLVADPEMGKFFAAHSNDSNMRTRQLAVDMLCSASGGPCVYIGRPMKQAHAGLHITEAHWNTAVTLLTATLNEFKVPQKEQSEFLALLTPLKNDIVEAK